MDKIVCLVNTDSEDRIRNAASLAALSPEYVYTCSFSYAGFPQSLRTPYYDNIYNTNNKVYDKVYDCALNHYKIVKCAYNQGYSRILVCEDDIELLPYFDKAVESIPEDADVVKLWSTGYLKREGWDGKSSLFKEGLYGDDCSTLCYMLSRKGMREYIAAQDMYFQPADMPFFTLAENKDIKYYHTIYNVCKPYGLTSLINN